MNCFSCSKDIKNIINCDKCSSKFCSDSCLAFHYIFYHNEEEDNNNNEKELNNSNNEIDYVHKIHSPYITKGKFLKEIKYESIFEIKNFKHQIVNGNPKLLGYGSFGKVYLEINKINKKFYAIKHMEKKRIFKALKTLEPIYSEIKIQSKISHPNIVKILYATENERFFDIVLEYSSKGNLFYYIQKNKNLSESNCFKIFIQILNAIYFLHENNYIHRDIKPENILLFENDVAKLCDFGWCVELKDEPRNIFCGTTEYMAPEMVNENRYGKEIDIWSLGILLYEMLHGHSPFKPNKPHFNDRDVINNIRFQKNIKYNNRLSKDCIELISHLIDKNIKRRYSLDDILNSKFVKNFEKNDFFIPKENKFEFEKITSSYRTINTLRTVPERNQFHEKISFNDQLTNINRRNTSNLYSNNTLNTCLTKENNNQNNSNNSIYISKNEKNFNTLNTENNIYQKSVSLYKSRTINPKFSSPKVEKINKKKVQKEEDYENDNLSNIFKDDSVFNNKNISKRHNIYMKNQPAININILFNQINFSSINNNNPNYENKIFKKILFNKNNNNSKNLRNSNRYSERNSNTMKIRENNFIKKQINIFTSKNCDINNLNDLKSYNTSKNIPVFIKQKNKNIPNNSNINEMKINKLINYFEFESNDNKNIKEKEKKNSFYYSKILDINNKIENNENNSDIIKKNEIESNQELNLKAEKFININSINQESKKKLGELLIERNNFYSNLTSLEDSFDNNCNEINLINKETIKTPKKRVDNFQITTKDIFSNLNKEIKIFNEKAKFD